MNRNNHFWLMILAALLCLLYSFLFLIKAKVAETEYQAADAAYELLSEQVIGTESKASENDPEPLPVSNIDFDTLQEINEDLGTWLYSPDTTIDYPVAHGTDNQFYLTHLADGTDNANGCLFIDYRNHADFKDPNTLIYGHHMKSGKMFASLVGYASQEYFEAHPVMYLTVDGHSYRLELFSGYTTTPESDAYRMSFRDSSDFVSWLKTLADRSDFQANIKLRNDDHIVTLSTCDYSFENARYVVHGRLAETE